MSFTADKPNMRNRILLPLLLLALGTPLLPAAHEMDENSITVVLHEKHHVSLLMRLDFTHLLQSHLAPASSEEEFLLAAAIADVGSLTPAYTQLQSIIEREFVIASRGTPLALSRWVWPSISVVHTAVRQQLAAQLVADEQLALASALEVRAEASDILPIEQLSLTLPDVLMPATILWYQPRQMFLLGDHNSTTLEF